MKCGEHIYPKYFVNIANHPDNGIGYEDIEEVVEIRDKYISIFYRISAFFRLLASPRSLARFVYVFEGIAKKEDEGKYYDVLGFRIFRVFIYFYSIVNWIMFKALEYFFLYLGDTVD